MAAQQPFAEAAFLKCELDQTSNWNNATSYSDVTTDLRFSEGVVWSRGRSDEFQSTSPGRASGTFLNRDRDYDPTSNTNIVPARPLKITCYYPTTATAYQQFSGLVEDWTPGWDIDGNAVTAFDAPERWSILQYYKVATTILPGSVSIATRLGQMADTAGWPTAERSFHAGGTVLRQSYTGVDILSAMQSVAAANSDVLYEQRTGTLTTKAMFSSTASNIGTFGDAGGSELPYAGIELGVGGEGFYTQVKVTSDGALDLQGQQAAPIVVTKNVGTPYTIAKFGTRTWELNVAAMSQTNVTSLATSLASTLASNPMTRIKSVKIRPMADPANIFPVILGADLGNTVTIKFTPPGGGSRISQALKIRSIRHEVNDRDWVCTWEVSP